VSEQTLPDSGDTWRHKKTGKDYHVTDIVQVEHPDTHEWIPGVLYETYSGPLYRTQYVRSMARFLDRFEFVRRG